MHTNLGIRSASCYFTNYNLESTFAEKPKITNSGIKNASGCITNYPVVKKQQITNLDIENATCCIKNISVENSFTKTPQIKILLTKVLHVTLKTKMLKILLQITNPGIKTFL